MMHSIKTWLIKKTAVIIAALAISTSALAQINPPVIYDSMPESGITLDKGWRFNPTDNADFAKPAYNDAKWDSIQPNFLMVELPQLKTVKVGWLRLHLSIGEKVAEKALILSTDWQNCASEIFLDGKLIAKYGIVNADPDKAELVSFNLLPIEIKLTPQKEHVLAVRFTPWHDKLLLKSDYGPLITLKIIDIAQNEKIWAARSDDYFDPACIAFFGLLFLLHLSFFRHNPSQRANLYFALYAISYVLCFTCSIQLNVTQNLYLTNICFVISYCFSLIAPVWMLNAIYNLFGFRIPRLMPAVWVGYAIAFFFMIFTHDADTPFLIGITTLGLIQLVLLIKALRLKKRGAGILVIALLASVIIVLAFNITAFLTISVWRNGFRLLYMIALYIVPAVGTSIYLSREFALDSKMLQEKLLEVERLSEQNLIQEQEKQQLLAKQNEILEQQVTERTSELTRSLDNLKQTQNQLIQSEKMASLGELTAGIAHEIQNPLNFVNNFSEVSNELIDEMHDELAKGDFDEAKSIADDIKQNLEKINYHGKRADAIVKGMLQHSRASSGQKGPTDINALADEYLRLAYHGLRAKDKSFNAELITNFAQDLPKANVISQDVGRVFLNLFTNAFYATQQQQKLAGSDYKPVLAVTTSQKGNTIEIVVKDNGTGIPDAIKDKILQPFFTTKPTGEGTGLGLSLSYDTIVKGHGGSIGIESKEGLGSTFIIMLPIN